MIQNLQEQVVTECLICYNFLAYLDNKINLCFRSKASKTNPGGARSAVTRKRTIQASLMFVAKNETMTIPRCSLVSETFSK